MFLQGVNLHQKTPCMKRIMHILLLIACVCPLISTGQTPPKFVYCDVIVGSGDLNTASRVTIAVDFGQKMKLWDNKMKDESGKPMKFNSLVDALNFMGRKGWEFVQSYSDQRRENYADHHFLMRKSFDSLDEETKKEYLKD